LTSAPAVVSVPAFTSWACLVSAPVGATVPASTFCVCSVRLPVIDSVPSRVTKNVVPPTGVK
jgi:hypothetical protein